MAARSRRLRGVAVGAGLVVLMLFSWLISGVATASSDSAADVAVAKSEEALVPAGQFVMGCAPDTWARCDVDSQPVHAVYLDAFYIDKTEVTVSQYYECVNAGACSPPSTSGASFEAFYVGDVNNSPVTYMTWDDADTYCRWVGKRLPTEAEWEKAAHGPSWQTYPWGNEAPTCDRLNFDSCIGGVVPVGSYPQNASPYGALDMAGNVREWVNDWYLRFYYERSPYFNPQGPPEELTVGEHLLRGGSWKDDFGGVTTYVRLDEAETHYIYKAGFRCARSAPASAMPTPAPTPTPFASGALDASGAAVWLSRPDHLALVQVPTGQLTYTTAITLTYLPDQGAGELNGIGHTFRLVADSDAPANPVSPGALERSVEVEVVFPHPLPIISGTLGLYRLDQGSWITDGITSVEWGANYLNATVGYPGVYAMLGRTNRIYVPVVMK